MGLREFKVAGIPAIVFRLGFVGELGYEIHVPATAAEYVWDQVLAVGQEFGIQPCGLETQRVLRLEKGHFIVGQDTDAMSTAEEINMTWAITQKKPFFIGKRSIELRNRALSKRKMVGFRLPTGITSMPQESNL